MPQLIATRTEKTSRVRPSVAKASAASNGMTSALAAVDKLQDQNARAGIALQGLSELWLSAVAKRRRAEAEMALSHFDSALQSLQKALRADQG